MLHNCMVPDIPFTTDAANDSMDVCRIRIRSHECTGPDFCRIIWYQSGTGGIQHWNFPQGVLRDSPPRSFREKVLFLFLGFTTMNTVRIIFYNLKELVPGIKRPFEIIGCGIGAENTGQTP